MMDEGESECHLVDQPANEMVVMLNLRTIYRPSVITV